MRICLFLCMEKRYSSIPISEEWVITSRGLMKCRFVILSMTSSQMVLYFFKRCLLSGGPFLFSSCNWWPLPRRIISLGDIKWCSLNHFFLLYLLTMYVWFFFFSVWSHIVDILMHFILTAIAGEEIFNTFLITSIWCSIL